MFSMLINSGVALYACKTKHSLQIIYILPFWFEGSSLGLHLFNHNIFLCKLFLWWTNRSFSSHYSSEINLICWSAAQETFRIIINVENRCPSSFLFVCGNHYTFFLGFFEKKVLNNSINLNFLFVCNYVTLHTHTHTYIIHTLFIYIDRYIDNVCVYTHTLPFKRCLMFFNVIYFSDSNQNFHLPFCQSAESHNPSEIIPICWFIINAVLFSFLFIKESWTKFQFPKNIKQKNCFQHW